MRRTTKKIRIMEMQYTMTIKGGYAIAKCNGFDSTITMPVHYAMKHMEEVSNFAKEENVHVVWNVVFE